MPAANGRDAGASLEEAIRGDSAAARALAERLSPVVRARVRRVLSRNRSITEREIQDVASEVWIALFENDWRKLRSYDPARGASLEGYVGLIAEREALNWVERHGAQKRGGGSTALGEEAALQLPSHDPSPEDVSATAELAGALETHLWEALPERGRLVLQHLYRDGNDVVQTARILGVKEQVVYNWQHKIRTLARDFLAVDQG